MKSSPMYEKVGELTEEIKTYHVNLQDTTTIVSNYLGNPRIIGGRPKWLCPFHSDQKPSFSVNKKDGKCGCFGCGAFFSNGIDFVMEYEGLSLPDAVLVTSDILGLDTTIDVSQIKREKEPRKIIKVDIPKKTERAEVSHKKLDFAYRLLFAAYCDANNNLILHKEHYDELSGERGYTDKQIKEMRFFTYPKNRIKVVDRMLSILNKLNIDPFVALAYVPGFSYNRKTNQWELMELFGDGYGFPIVDEDGLIVAIQIRITSKTNGMKYTWLTSTDGMNPIDSEEPKVYGNSPGAPLSVVYTETGKSKRVLITEGFHKAVKCARNLGEDSYTTITAQGVNNTAGIAKFLKNVCTKANCGFLDIAFDGDMAIKETVLKPALKLGLNLSGLPFTEEMKKGVVDILSQSNKDEKTIPHNYREIANQISEFLHKNEDKMWFAEICFLLWETEEEKGIDDLILAGKKHCIRRLSLANFWDLAYAYLSQADYERLQLAKASKQEFRKVDIDKSRRETIFKTIAGTLKNEKVG